MGFNPPDFTQRRRTPSTLYTMTGEQVIVEESWVNSPGHFSSLSGQWSDGESGGTCKTYYVGDQELKSGELLVDSTTSQEVVVLYWNGVEGRRTSATATWLPEGAAKDQESFWVRERTEQLLVTLFNRPTAAKSEKNTARAAKRAEAQARWEAEQVAAAQAKAIRW